MPNARFIFVRSVRSYKQTAMSPHYCDVYGCKNNTKLTPHLSFFSLPKDEKRKKKWIELMDRPDILKVKKPRHLVCSAHFTEDMFKNKRLQPDAVPTLLLPGSTVPSCRSPSNLNVETQVDKPVIVKMVQDKPVPDPTKVTLEFSVVGTNQMCSGQSQQAAIQLPVPPAPTDTESFVLSVETCVCCLGNQAEELLWARRDDGGSYGGIVKALFGIQFPVPDVIAMSTRICSACIEQLERTLELRTRLLDAQTRLTRAHWLLPTGHPTDQPAELLCTESDSQDEEMEEREQTEIEIKTEHDVQIEEMNDEEFIRKASSSTVSLPLAAAPQTAGRKRTAQRDSHSKAKKHYEQPAKTDTQEHKTAMNKPEIKLKPLHIVLEPLDIKPELLVIKEEADPLEGDVEVTKPNASPQLPTRPRRP